MFPSLPTSEGFVGDSSSFSDGVPLCSLHRKHWRDAKSSPNTPVLDHQSTTELSAMVSFCTCISFNIFYKQGANIFRTYFSFICEICNKYLSMFPYYYVLVKGYGRPKFHCNFLFETHSSYMQFQFQLFVCFQLSESS